MIDMYDKFVQDSDYRYTMIAEMCGVDEAYLEYLREGKYTDDELTRLTQLVGGVMIAEYACESGACHAKIREAMDYLDTEKEHKKITYTLDDMADSFEANRIHVAAKNGFTTETIRAHLRRMGVEPTDLRVRETALMIGGLIDDQTELVRTAYDAVERNHARYGTEI